LGGTLNSQPQGNLIVVLDTTDPLDYTVQIFDGSSNANGAPVGIGPAALTHIAISGGTNGTFNSLTLTAEAAAGNKFIDWIGAYPNVGAEAALTDDPDRDGIDSGVENFFGTDPSVASQGLVSGTVSGNNFTFTHPQGTLADNLTAAYRWSKDLQTFYGNLSTDGDGTTVEFTVQLDTPSLGTTTVTATVTGTATDKLFVNVGVIKDDEYAEVVVMLGDSTTEQGLPTEVKLQLDALITDPLLQTTVINSGKGGDNATAALARLQTDVLDHNPDIVTVSFGLNDTALRDPEQFEQSMSQIITTLQNAGIQVVLLTSTPFDNARHSWGPDFVADGGLDEYMDSNLLERTRSLAAANTLPLGDLHTIFTDAFQLDSNLINVVISSDGVHLTQAGKVMAAENIAPALYPLLIAN
jgi:lysophospholipase L1-like esterase